MAKTPERRPEIELLKRYRAGNCTPEEIKQVDEWFDAHEQEEVPLLLRSRSVWRVNEAVMQSIRSSGQKQHNGLFFLKVAAMLLLTFTAGLFAYRQLRPAKEMQAAYTTISTKRGERKNIILPDSSQISLNNESSVRFISDFKGTTRTIALTGEAFFNVRHNKKRPFIVNAGKLHVQVLGTSFDVKAFPGETISKVTVATGKVGVYKSGEAARMLLPGDQLSYDHSLQQFTTRKVKTEDQYAWQKNILIFKGENLQEIALQLERWYGVKITISSNRLKRERFNIKQNNESLRHVLESLSLSGDGFRYSIKNQQVSIW